MKIIRWISRAIGTLLALLLAVALVSTLAYRLRSIPRIPDETAATARLKGTECKIGRDAHGIPHVQVGATAPGTKDDPALDELRFLACTGFIHGTDRAWQMDFLRMIAEGRKAESTGADGIESDFVLRLLGLHERGEALYAQLPQDLRDRFDAYSWGVNQAFAQGTRSYEYAKLGTKPEPWRPEDTLSLVLLQSFNQTRRSLEQDFKEDHWSQVLGDTAPALTAEHGLPWETTVIRESELPESAEENGELRAEPSSDAASATAIPGLLDATERMWGSNNWVIAPKRSKSGHAFFANDPHLGLKHPPFWHWAHVTSATRDVMAASLPGTPVFASGLNGRVAWGLTNAYMDVTDASRVDERELAADARVFRPLIWFKLGPLHLPFAFKTFRRTSTGMPIIARDAGAGRAFAMKWTGFQLRGEDLRGLFELIAAKNVRDTDLALSRARIPNWNFVFADVNGGIGYRVIGLAPRRDRAPVYGIPTVPLSEANRPFDVLSDGEMPHLLSPARGFIATANNRQWPTESGLNSGRAAIPPFRAYRIEELIQKTPRHDAASIQAIQCDSQSVDARFLYPLLAPILRASAGTLPEAEKKGMAALEDWAARQDFRAGLDCKACGLYRRWIQRIFEASSYDEAILFRELGGLPSHSSQSLPTPETTKLVLDAYHAAAADVGTAAWGEIHRNFFAHLLPALARPDSLGTPGDKHSVSPGDPQWREGHPAAPPGARGIFEQEDGSSQRLVIEMSDPPRVYLNLTGSNLDVEAPKLSAENSPWENYVNCRTPEVQFHPDWSQLKVEARTLGAR